MLKRIVLIALLSAALVQPAFADESAVRRNTTILRIVVGIVQIRDAVHTNAQLRAGGRELDPIVKPFTHGGVPTLVAGFLLQDIAHRAILRAVGLRSTIAEPIASAYEINESVMGVINSNMNRAPKPMFGL